MSEGWVKLDRAILDHWIWKEKPFTKGQAWVDLILLANHKDKKVAYKGEIIICKRGEVNRSITELAKRWGWSRDKARRFLDILQQDEMILVNATTNRTTITLINYGIFQLLPTTDKATSRQRADTNKNDKNEKNIYKPNNFTNFENKQNYDFDELERLMQ